MKFTRAALAGACLLAAATAQAAVTETAVVYTDPAAPSGGLTYGFEASDALPAWISFSGGHVFADGDVGVGDITAKPPGTLGQNWWSVGASEPQALTGTVHFAGGAREVSFLWGSPDTYNELTYTYTSGDATFVNTVLGTSLTGDRSVGVYLKLTATEGDAITGLSFKSGNNAFEVDNFRVSAIPEPHTVSLLLAGLGAMFFVARVRKA